MGKAHKLWILDHNAGQQKNIQRLCRQWLWRLHKCNPWHYEQPMAFLRLLQANREDIRSCSLSTVVLHMHDVMAYYLDHHFKKWLCGLVNGIQWHRFLSILSVEFCEIWHVQTMEPSKLILKIKKRWLSGAFIGRSFAGNFTSLLRRPQLSLITVMQINWLPPATALHRSTKELTQ